MKKPHAWLLPLLLCLLAKTFSLKCKADTSLFETLSLKDIVRIEPTSNGVQITVDANFKEKLSTKLGIAVRVVEKVDDNNTKFEFVNLEKGEIYSMDKSLPSDTQFYVESYFVTPLGPIGEIVTQKFSTLPEKMDCALKLTSVIAYPDKIIVGLDKQLCSNFEQESLILNLTSENVNGNGKSASFTVTNIVDVKVTNNQVDVVFSLENAVEMLSVCEKYNVSIYLQINDVKSHVTMKPGVQPKLGVIEFQIKSPIVINDPTPNVPDNVEGDYTSEAPSAILKFALDRPLKCLIHGLKVTVNKYTETAYMTSGQNGIIVLSQQSLKILKLALNLDRAAAKIHICLTQPPDTNVDLDEEDKRNKMNCQIMHTQILSRESNKRNHDELKSVKVVHKVNVMSKENEILFRHCHDQSVYLTLFEYSGSTMKRQTHQKGHGCPQGQQETIMKLGVPEASAKEKTITYKRFYYGNIFI